MRDKEEGGAGCTPFKKPKRENNVEDKEKKTQKREKVRGAAAHRGGQAWEDGGDIINRPRRVYGRRTLGSVWLSSASGGTQRPNNTKTCRARPKGALYPPSLPPLFLLLFL